jgi:hypothetical protein
MVCLLGNILSVAENGKYLSISWIVVSRTLQLLRPGKIRGHRRTFATAAAVVIYRLLAQVPARADIRCDFDHRIDHTLSRSWTYFKNT